MILLDLTVRAIGILIYICLFICIKEELEEKKHEDKLRNTSRVKR